MLILDMGIKFLFALPFLEIFFFVLFGDLLGFLNALLLIIISSLIGFWLIFSFKFDVEKDIKSPSDWIFGRLAGILLLIPGFLTDILGIIVLIKPLRKIVYSFFPNEMKNFSNNFNFTSSNNRSEKSKIIEGDFKDLDS
tara:strand:- start:72 stop:488 length:417 start_codon:yes stop_codon:yes gene_type:complete